MEERIRRIERVGVRVRVHVRDDRPREDMPHRSIEEGLEGTIIRCEAGQDGPLHS